MTRERGEKVRALIPLNLDGYIFSNGSVEWISSSSSPSNYDLGWRRLREGTCDRSPENQPYVIISADQWSVSSDSQRHDSPLEG